MPKIITDPKKIEKIVSSRYIEAIFPSRDALKNSLMSGKRLKIYLGIDPTGPQLHLGHLTNFLMLKKFQEMGHEVILLIGDFTARIGDPTGKSAARKSLTKKEILENCVNYKSRAEKILNFGGKNPVKLEFNGRWYENMPLEQIIKLMAKATHGQMIKRDMFQERIRAGKEIYLHEFLYPLLQGYDSVALNTDVEIGGNDQTFNMMVGRDLVKEYQKREKFIVATKLLINPKTQKKLMSKSEGGFIALDLKPNEMYGKIMSMPDEAIIPCLEMCTEMEQGNIENIKNNLPENINPRDAKARLAKEIITLYYSREKAAKAEKEFNKIFRDKELPSEIPEIPSPSPSPSDQTMQILDLLVKTKLASSKSEAKRLVEGKAVEIDGKVILDWKKTVEIKNRMVIKVGKRKFVKIHLW